MHYIIQENLFREEGHAKLISCLERFKISYELVNVKPFVEEVEYRTERQDVFVFGSLKLARLAKNYNWNPGAVVTENHDYEVYSKHYKEELLNYDSRVFEFAEDFEWLEDQHFIRPCLDSKVFTGKVFDKADWPEFRERMLTNGHTTSLDAHTKIQVALPKMLTQEVRVWVVNGRIVTQSTYRRGSFLFYDANVDPDALEYAQKMIDKFQLAKTFVMDIGLTRNGWKIIECGSTSCAGFYDADMQKIVMALEEEYNVCKPHPSIDGLYTHFW
jgi:hypothetical protein